jgi:internalin A
MVALIGPCFELMMVLSLVWSAQVLNQEIEVSKIKKAGSSVLLDRTGSVRQVFFSYKNRGHILLPLWLNDVTDAEIQTVDFSVFHNLGFLSLRSVMVSDLSLVHVSKTDFKLLALSIYGGRITDEGLRTLLKKQSKLRYATFMNIPLTDKSLAVIENLLNLEDLVMRGTQITDEGLRCLARLRKLRFLDVSQTNLTDKGIPELVRLETLRTLIISDTKISEAGLHELRAAIPLADVRGTNGGAAGKNTP